MIVIVIMAMIVVVFVVVLRAVVMNAPGMALLVIVVPVTAAIGSGLRLERCLHGLK